MANLKAAPVARATLMSARWNRYRRCVDRGDFSLEANTETVPEPGFFFLLRAGEVLLQSDDYAIVEAAYNQLCREFWESHLTSTAAPRRVASAWGLLSLEPNHACAAAVIEQDGAPEDRNRLVRARNRSRYLRRLNTTRPAVPAV
ncbi:MAG: hypothetical protein K0Q72_1040 [Armatimonadetes bacterium]|jgi:hypothetical protein|nr:hypothetical protein [Armatimonadota bacterium]